MAVRITGLLVIAVMNGYFSHLVIGNCPVDSDNLNLTEASGTITFDNVGEQIRSDCEWTLPPMPMGDYFFVFNISAVFMSEGYMRVSHTDVLYAGRYQPSCKVFYASSSSTSKPYPQRIGKYDKCANIVITTSLLPPIFLSINSARFTAHYDFISCQATTPSPVISTSPKSASQTPKISTMQTSTRSSPLSAGSRNEKDYAEATRTSMPYKKKTTKSTVTSPEHIPTKFATTTSNGHQDPLSTGVYSTTVLNDETEGSDQPSPTGYIYWVLGCLVTALLFGLAVGLFMIRKRDRNRPIPPRNVHTLETGVAGGKVNSVRIAESRGSDGRQVLYSTGSGMERPEYVSQPNPLYAAARDPDPARHVDYEMVDNFSYNM